MTTTTVAGARGSPDRGAAVQPRFRSILYSPDGADPPPTRSRAPDYFSDLRLDAVVDAVTANHVEQEIAPYFWTPVADVAGVEYRQEVFGDLEQAVVRDSLVTFTKGMASVRACLGREAKSRHRWERARWRLDGASLYIRSVSGLASTLDAARPPSRALSDLAEFLAAYVASDAFRQLAEEAQAVNDKLSTLRYRMRIEGDRIMVSRYRDEPDYGAEVLQAFAKFQQAEGSDYEFEFSSRAELNHVEAAVLDLVAELYPAEFGRLLRFTERHAEFADPIVTRLDREVQFYLAYLDYIDRLAQRGLPFCRPQMAVRPGRASARDMFDMALATSLVDEDVPVVTNDFEMRDPERVLVVSGPNQGGKTTFARTIGQLHHLGALGVPVPGSEATLELVDQIFAHFERAEEVEDLAGKLEDDLRRMHEILGRATDRSLLVMNESFSSTTLTDQLAINKRILATVIERRTACVVVTFLDELAAMAPQTVSVVSQVDPDEPSRRTFKILRRPADGLAYALALAAKHQLTYGDLKRRLDR